MVICETEFPQILNDINKFLGSYNVELVFVKLIITAIFR